VQKHIKTKMKTQLLIAYIGVWGSLIMANTVENKTIGWIFIAQAIILLIRTAYLDHKISKK